MSQESLPEEMQLALAKRASMWPADEDWQSKQESGRTLMHAELLRRERREQVARSPVKREAVDLEADSEEMLRTLEKMSRHRLASKPAANKPGSSAKKPVVCGFSSEEELAYATDGEVAEVNVQGKYVSKAAGKAAAKAAEEAEAEREAKEAASQEAAKVVREKAEKLALARARQLVLPAYKDELIAHFGSRSAERREKAVALIERLDAAQLRAAHAGLVRAVRCLAVVGAAGTGKSALLKLMALDTEEGKEDELGVVTPTKGAQRICQDNIDEVLPRKGFKPVVEALTTFVGFGVKVKEPWSVLCRQCATASNAETASAPRQRSSTAT